MMLVAPTGASAPAVYWHADGVSEDSRRIKAMARRLSGDSRREPASFAWRTSLLDDLSEIIRTCSGAGWDGYDAEPVLPESAICAALLVELLPEGIEVPHILPEPNGDVVLEWLGDDKHFTLSLSGRSVIYAGILGAVKKYGEEPFWDELPQTGLEILSSYFAKA